MLENDPELKPQYRMPRIFGALPGPRNVPVSRQGLRNNQQSSSIAVSFETDARLLAQWLPQDCEVDGLPILTVSLTYITNIGWLAGRGYNLIVVSLPMKHKSTSGEVRRGRFLPVVWENLADPIITGREELGWSKLYAEIPPAVVIGDCHHGRALWDGFKFLDVKVSNAQESAIVPQTIEGSFHYKYIPATGKHALADADYLEYSPPGVSATGYGGMQVTRVLQGEGSVAFHPAAWEDVPFQYPILNALAALPVTRVTNATVTYARADAVIGNPSTGPLGKVD